MKNPPGPENENSESPAEPSEESREGRLANHPVWRTVRQREENMRDLDKAVKELRPPPSFSFLFWRGFLVLGVVSTAYFFTLIYRDPAIFRDGLRILVAGAWQLLVAGAFWGFVFWKYQGAEAAQKQKMERWLIFSVLGFLALVAAIFYLFFGAGRLLAWLNPIFLLTLGVQVGLWIFCLHVQRNGWREIEEGKTEYVWTKPIIYMAEGAMGYLSLGILLQAVFQINVPMIFASVLSRPAAGALFFFPFAAYVLIRRIFAL